jgi:hypothetical protein
MRRPIPVISPPADHSRMSLPAFHLTVVGACVGLLFLADRSHLFNKEQKQFEPLLFSAALLLALATGLLRLETSKDQAFLNRKQTDEWKGWMQSKRSNYPCDTV